MTTFSDQPPGIDDDTAEYVSPDPTDAAQRILEYVGWFGDGLIDGDPDGFPLFSRDLESVAQAFVNARVSESTQTPDLVTTAEELDALPVGSVIVDTSGIARTKSRAGMWAQPGMDPCPMHLLVDGHAFTVVWVAGGAR